jgi:hypothetical protein
MNNPDASPKPTATEQPADEGLDETPCSALGFSSVEFMEMLGDFHSRLDRLQIGEAIRDALAGLNRFQDSPKPTTEIANKPIRTALNG